ncbi:MAG TPA: Ser-Thr-rich GPI-anchored membrane family protein [Candidatus Hydrogenedentes bacterium]|nr:Ser-Thr-rich GPI-anchored membrane family protein [Candidatus Hydrogenedentota bacterium]HPG70080.1 Ser-Thr-rich GPI-anchored membrane family protein [Candidatus Hydrogenedentota bacterium]
MRTLHGIDLVVLLLYFGAMAAMGPLFARRNRTTEGYFLGDRSFPGWLTGISMFATSISSITFVAYPADAYKTAWLRMMPNFMLPIGVAIAVVFFIPFFRRSHITSAFEYLEGRFGPNIRLYAACAFIVGQIIRVSMILFLVSILVYELTGIPKLWSILLGGVVTGFYSILGGIRAVLWTDFIQAIVLWVGGLLCVVVAIVQVPGGLPRILSEAAQDGKFKFADYAKDGTHSTVLIEATENDGEFTWSVPEDLREAGDYMIRIASTTQDSVRDVSNANFSVGDEEQGNARALLAPNWGEEWVVGETRPIRWRPGPSPSPVRISLLQGKEEIRTLAEQAADTGVFEWAIPSDLAPGKDYRVAIESVGGQDRVVSAAYLWLLDAPAANALAVVSPNGSDVWQPGSTQTITWDSAAKDVATVRIELVEGRRLQPASKRFTFTEKTIWVMLILGLANWLAEYSSNQNVVQRYAASKTPKEARRASWICCFFSVPTWALFMFLGTCLYIFYKVSPTPESTAMLHGIHNAKAEEILPFFVLRELPTGVSGLVIAGVLAAAMSSLSASINGVSAVGIVDVYRRRLVKQRDDRHYVIVAKSIGIAMSFIMIVGAKILMDAETKTLQDTATVLGALSAGGLLGLYMLGFMTKVGDGRAVGLGIVATLLFSAWMALSSLGWLPEHLESSIDSYWAGILGHVITFLVGFGVGCLLPKRPRDLTNLTVWTQDGTPLE